MTLSATLSNHRILGQAQARTALTRSLVGGQVHHAWIFHGPLGVGKCTTAIEFARLLLDAEASSEHRHLFEAPRGTRVAQLIDAGSHPDLHVIRKERSEDSQIASLREKKQTNIPIDLLRELMLGGNVDGKSFDGPVWRTSYVGYGKVFIIDEAELLDHVGQNSLLKTLEEPPPNTYIILITAREDRLLPTIRSRCQRVAFTPLSKDAMQEWFSRNPLAFGGSSVDARSLDWIARFADGSPGLAMLAARHGVHLWANDLASSLADSSKGTFVAALSERMSELVSGCAEAAVKENAKASKEAANRLGARLLFGVLSQHVRDGLVQAAEAGDLGLAERWAQLVDVIDAADEQIRRNLNQKQVLANLVAQWVGVAPFATSGARR